MRSIGRCWRSSPVWTASDRARALDAAVDRYLSRPDVALPDVPKDMTILYDHPYTSFVDEDFTPRRKLTVPEPDRLRLGLALVPAGGAGTVGAARRFRGAPRGREGRDGAVPAQALRREAAGRLPHGAAAGPVDFPGLVSAHLRAAAIIDNLNMMHDVLADVLVHPKVADVRAAIDEVIVQFTDPRYRVVEVDDWITMALRHSIFAAGRARAGDDDGRATGTAPGTPSTRAARGRCPRGACGSVGNR